jgi:PTH2 family peptidyl-tRNA hydrolase
MTKDMDEIVQYFIVNKEIKMSAPKLAAQVGHVATIITHEITKIMYQPINENTIFFDPKTVTKINDWIEWFNEGKNQKKIILVGKEKDLLKLIEQGFYYIRDNGCNELLPGTLTCVGLPPMKRSEAQKYVKRLQLYKGD